MRVQGSGLPETISIESYFPKPGTVEVRLRENIEGRTYTDEITQRQYTMYEYDEYLFHLPEKEGLREEIEGNLDEWLLTGRTIEVNARASIVQDMRTALTIMGVNINE